MSNILFGLNIAEIVNNAITDAGGVLPAVLIQRTNVGRVAGNLTCGANPSIGRHDCRGFVENRSEVRRNGSLVSQGGQFVSILGASLPDGVTPSKGDDIFIENTTFNIISIPNRDPAAAVWECLVGETS